MWKEQSNVWEQSWVWEQHERRVGFYLQVKVCLKVMVPAGWVEVLKTKRGVDDIKENFSCKFCKFKVSECRWYLGTVRRGEEKMSIFSGK